VGHRRLEEHPGEAVTEHTTHASKHRPLPTIPPRARTTALSSTVSHHDARVSQLGRTPVHLRMLSLAHDEEKQKNDKQHGGHRGCSQPLAQPTVDVEHD
jgi:hypothetical protein